MKLYLSLQDNTALTEKQWKRDFDTFTGEKYFDNADLWFATMIADGHMVELQGNPVLRAIGNFAYKAGRFIVEAAMCAFFAVGFLYLIFG